MALQVVVANGSVGYYPFGGVDPTYSVTAFIPSASIPAASGDLVAIKMPASNANMLRLLRVKAQIISGTASTTIPMTLFLGKRTTPDTGTASSTVLPTPEVTNDPVATAIVQVFTTGSTSGAGSTTPPTQIETLQLNNNVVGYNTAEVINFPAIGAKPPTLQGPFVLTTADQLVLYLCTTVASGGSTYVSTTGAGLNVTLYFAESPLTGAANAG